MVNFSFWGKEIQQQKFRIHNGIETDLRISGASSSMIQRRNSLINSIAEFENRQANELNVCL